MGEVEDVVDLIEDVAEGVEVEEDMDSLNGEDRPMMDLVVTIMEVVDNLQITLQYHQINVDLSLAKVWFFDLSIFVTKILVKLAQNLFEVIDIDISLYRW